MPPAGLTHGKYINGLLRARGRRCHWSLAAEAEVEGRVRVASRRDPGRWVRAGSREGLLAFASIRLLCPGVAWRGGEAAYGLGAASVDGRMNGWMGERLTVRVGGRLLFGRSFVRGRMGEARRVQMG